jgi:hypothetical protein
MAKTKAALRRGEVLSLPTPLARLYGLAMCFGIEVRDGGDCWDDMEHDVAALCVFGKYIAINPGIDDDQLRAQVLAMALSILPGMTNVPECDEPGSIYTRHGYVCITFDRVPASEATSIGKVATIFARQCGLDTVSAAFEWYVPTDEDEADHDHDPL